MKYPWITEICLQSMDYWDIYGLLRYPRITDMFHGLLWYLRISYLESVEQGFAARIDKDDRDRVNGEQQRKDADIHEE